MLPHPFQEPVGDLVSHVKADPVDVVFPDPVLTHPAEVLDHFLVVCIEFGHPVCEGKGIEPSVPGVPCLPDLGPVLHHEPFRIGGRSPFFLYIQPGREFPPAVVEHSVHHDADPPVVGLGDEPPHDPVVPKGRIDLRVVRSVIFMVRLRLHDGVQINPGDPQILEVGKFLPDPFQIAAVLLTVRHFSRLPGKDIRILPLRRTIEEPVRKDLIPDRAVDPFRRPVHVRRVHPGNRKALEHPPVHIDLLLCQETVLKIIPGFLFCVKFEIVFTSLIGRDQRGSPPELMGKTFLIDDLLPFSRPFFISSQDPRLEGIPVMDEHPFYVIPGLQVDDQTFFIQWITHLFRRFVIYSCKFHRQISSLFRYLFRHFLQMLIYSEDLSHAPCLCKTSL